MTRRTVQLFVEQNPSHFGTLMDYFEGLPNYNAADVGASYERFLDARRAADPEQLRKEEFAECFDIDADSLDQIYKDGVALDEAERDFAVDQFNDLTEKYEAETQEANHALETADHFESELKAAQEANQKLADELADLKAQNRVLTDTISEERNSYKSGMQSIKNSITEQVSEMKSMLGEMRQTLTGSLKDVLKWRRDNGINDGAELGQIVRSASKPKQKSDYDNTPRLN